MTKDGIIKIIFKKVTIIIKWYFLTNTIKNIKLSIYQINNTINNLFFSNKTLLISYMGII